MSVNLAKPSFLRSKEPEEDGSDYQVPLPSVDRLFAKFNHYVQRNEFSHRFVRETVGRTPEILELYVQVMEALRIGCQDQRLVTMEYDLIDTIYKDPLFERVTDALQNIDEFIKRTSNQVRIPCLVTFDTLETLKRTAETDPGFLQELKAKLPDLFIDDKFYWLSKKFRNYRFADVEDLSIQWDELYALESAMAGTSAYMPSSPSYCPASPPRELTSPSRCPVHAREIRVQRCVSPPWAPGSPPHSDGESETCSCKGGPFPKPLVPPRVVETCLYWNEKTSCFEERLELQFKSIDTEEKNIHGDPEKVVELKRDVPLKRVTQSRSQSAKRVRFQK